jgi:UDP-N-acetylmuramoyl-tripeptide--D-alanyl-D-alanine ligase
MRVDAQELAAAAGGVLTSCSRSARARGQVCVDTRLLIPGDVFVALPGTRTDGSRFIAQALRRGADGVIAPARALRDLPADVIAVAVDDPREALRSLARARRAVLLGHAIGVTGSVGKTTTLEILARTLERSMRTDATRGGFNTHQGVAATIAGAAEDCDALVVELSMEARGHIASKAALLQPTAGLLTKIAPAHLETSGTIENVARNKAELIEALPAGAPCVVPAREPLLAPYLRPDLETVTHGPGGDVRIEAATPGVVTLRLGDTKARIRHGFSQAHNISNLVAAMAMLHALGIDPPADVEVELPALRWQLVRLNAVELILDCASSSPHALYAALEALAAEPASRRLAVLGPVVRLGDAAAAYHAEAGAIARKLGIDAIIAVGERSREYFEGYRGETHQVETPEQARELLDAIGRPGDRVLVKGCRATELERIVG